MNNSTGKFIANEWNNRAVHSAYDSAMADFRRFQASEQRVAAGVHARQLLDSQRDSMADFEACNVAMREAVGRNVRAIAGSVNPLNYVDAYSMGVVQTFLHDPNCQRAWGTGSGQCGGQGNR